LQKSGDIRVAEAQTLFELSDLIDLDAIVLDDKAKQKHLQFNNLPEVKFQPRNPAKYVGLIALKNFANEVREELLPHYIQGLGIEKSIETS
jgi:hypothetical protein